MNVSINELANLIAKEMEEYSEEVAVKVEEQIANVADEALESLKTNPVLKELNGSGFYGRKTERYGHYKDGFYAKDVYKARGKHKGFFKMTIANKKYQLTHLLEYGHAKRNGGRTRAFPHWGDAQKVADTLPDRIKEVLEG